MKFDQKSASRADVRHENGLKTILFQEILGRTHFKHVFRNYAVIAIILGIVMSLIIKPGSRISSADQTALSGLYSNETREGNSVADGLLDIIRNTVSGNLK